MTNPLEGPQQVDLETARQRTGHLSRRGAQRRLVDEIAAGVGDDPGPGGWSGGFANQAHWDPSRSRDWRCWAQSGPTWSAHCGTEVEAGDTLGLCQRHRRSLLEGDAAAPNLSAPAPGLGSVAGLGSGAGLVPEPALIAG
ncbi:MAG TPA: hypothetical protein VFN61_15285 [Acidimicrobiales bacterium]|nr:hypothetical protein [Acidimicrobiales bacterium]